MHEVLRFASERPHNLASSSCRLRCASPSRPSARVHPNRDHAMQAGGAGVASRRARRPKTDRLDVGKLLALLLRWCGGERTVWSVVHATSPETEAQRQLTREIATVREDRKRVRNQIQALLATQGIRNTRARRSHPNRTSRRGSHRQDRDHPQRVTGARRQKVRRRGHLREASRHGLRRGRPGRSTEVRA